MSINNSILTRASKSGEYAADAVSFRHYHSKQYVQAVKYYGIQRGRPIFSTLPSWWYNVWLSREQVAITPINETITFSSGSQHYCIAKGEYIVQLSDGNIIDIIADIFERDYQPIISSK